MAEHLYIETTTHHGEYAETIEVGATNSLYLLVDVDTGGNPFGVEVLDAAEKLAPSNGYSIRDDGTVVFSDEATCRHEVVYGSLAGEIAYSHNAHIVEMRFWRLPDDHPKSGKDNHEDPCFERFLKEKVYHAVGRSPRSPHDDTASHTSCKGPV